jgi:copper(I)-binding protein
MRTPLLLLAALGLAGPALPASAHHTEAKPVVSDAWVRETPPGKTVTAAYLTIENKDHEADFLLAAECEAAGLVELHTMKVEGEQMKMEKLEKIEIRPHEKTRLAPGGLHVMLFDLKRPLPAGETVELKLRFQVAGEVVVKAVVKAPPSRP